MPPSDRAIARQAPDTIEAQAIIRAPTTDHIARFLDAFHGRDPDGPWAWFVQATREVSEHDFRILTSIPGGVPEGRLGDREESL